MNPLLKLLAKNKGKGQPIKAKTEGEEATLYVYDVIVSDEYWGGVGAESFVKALNKLDAPTIHLRINSPGGDVFAARAMVQAIKDHSSKIVAHVDGMAASAATFLVIAADESVINEGGMFMIHNAWTIAAGNAKDFISTADLLSKIDESLVRDYAAKTNIGEEEVRQWMDAETYFIGQEAVEAGFVSAIAEAAPKNKIAWDLSAYKHAPEPTAQGDATTLTAKADEEITAGVTEAAPAPAPELEPEKPDLSAHYRQLEVVTLTA